MAPFWSVFLVNLGFVGLGYEAISSQTSRWWLMAPILSFAGYGTFVFYDNSKQIALAAELASDNANVLVPFDPNKEDLFYDGDDAFVLVQDYSLPAVYSKSTVPINGIKSDAVKILLSATLCESLRHRSYANVRTEIFGSVLQQIGQHLSRRKCAY